MIRRVYHIFHIAAAVKMVIALGFDVVNCEGRLVGLIAVWDMKSFQADRAVIVWVQFGRQRFGPAFHFVVEFKLAVELWV